MFLANKHSGHGVLEEWWGCCDSSETITVPPTSPARATPKAQDIHLPFLIHLPPSPSVLCTHPLLTSCSHRSHCPGSILGSSRQGLCHRSLEAAPTCPRGTYLTQRLVLECHRTVSNSFQSRLCLPHSYHKSPIRNIQYLPTPSAHQTLQPPGLCRCLGSGCTHPGVLSRCSA